MMKKISMLLLAAGASIAFTATAQAAVLIMSDASCSGGACTNGQKIDQSYGASSEIDVQWRGTSALAATDANRFSYWSNNYSDLSGIAYGSSRTAAASIFFAPLKANTQVTLNSFRLGSWLGFNRLSSFVIFEGVGKTLFSSGSVPVGPGLASSLFSPKLTSANGLGIQYGPDSLNVGIDNIDFSVSAIAAVPEPTTWAMLILGFGVIGGAMRSARRQPVRVRYA